MSTSTQAMNNINKVQTQSTSGKPKQANEPVELNFNDLFSSAMGKMAPNSQLNNIESQLRESLFKQDKPKKNNDSNMNAEAAQAAMWAQRDWLQSSATPQLNASEQSTNRVEEQRNAGKTQQLNEQSTEQSIEQSTEQSTEQATSKPLEKSKSSTDNVKATESESEAQAASTGESKTQAVTASLAGSANPVTSAASASATTDSATNSVKPVPSEMSTNAFKTEQTIQSVVDTTQPQEKTGTSNTKLDAILNNGSVSNKAEVQAQPAAAAAGVGAGNSGNPANNAAVNAQLAPQVAQQAQNFGGKLEAEELKVGQKILANGNLQSTGTANGIAAGTNGLTGTNGATPHALIKTPVNQPGFAKELGQTVNWAIGKNMSTVDIRVNPETFGPMNMRLVQKGQQVQLVIRTQDEASANLLTQALGGLKEVLAQNGLQLNQVQIQHGNTSNGNANSQANNGQSQFDQGNGQNRGGQQSANSGSPEQDTTALNMNPSNARKAEGKLDLFA